MGVITKTKERKKKQFFFKMSVYATIDFESVDTSGKWWCYGIMVAEYPSGNIVCSHHGKCPRTIDEFDDPTRQFWDQHPSSFDIISKYPSTDTVTVAEQQLCRKVYSILLKYPHVRLVSDNPGFDIRILDNIMVKYGYKPTSHRANGGYLQCTCTWSYQLPIMRMYKIQACELDEYMHAIGLGYALERSVTTYFGPKHTPRADCARILSQHFKMLDLEKEFFLRALERK